MRHPVLACAPTNGFQQLVQYAPSLFPAKNRRNEVTVMLKTKLKDPSSENFLATGGFFERNTYRIMVLGWLKKEEDEQL